LHNRRWHIETQHSKKKVSELLQESATDILFVVNSRDNHYFQDVSLDNDIQIQFKQ